MSELNKKWIVAGVDGSDISHAVVDYAAWAAQKLGSPLELVHTLEHSLLLEHTDHSGNLTPNIREHLMRTLSEDEQTESKRLMEAGKVILQNAKARTEGHTIAEVTLKQRHGSLADALKDLEEEIRILVLGVRGEEHHDEVHAIGGQLEETIRNLHRPILIVNGPFSEPKKVMLAINDTVGAEKAIEMVAKSPMCVGMEIHLVNVSNDAQASQALLSKAAEPLKASGHQPVSATLTGDPQSALLDYQTAQEIDLTVMGAFSHGRLRSLFFGSFTLKMLENTNQPLLLLR
jgi:nucleotide-binding universal stress UspA family protein